MIPSMLCEQHWNIYNIDSTNNKLSFVIGNMNKVAQAKNCGMDFIYVLSVWMEAIS